MGLFYNMRRFILKLYLIAFCILIFGSIQLNGFLVSSTKFSKFTKNTQLKSLSKDISNDLSQSWWQFPNKNDITDTLNTKELGDITKDRDTLVQLSEKFNPMERVILSANGYLQRILSAYYNDLITITVVKSQPDGHGKYERAVQLFYKDQLICDVVGEIHVYDKECLEAIESKRVGVGQLFKFLGILPNFKLLQAGKVYHPNHPSKYSIWREYELDCPKFFCRFEERFAPDFLDLK